MIEMLKRHEIQVLRRAGHTWAQVAELAGVSIGTARRVAAEDGVTTVDNAAERARRQIGRPSKAEAYREVLMQALAAEPTLKSVERCIAHDWPGTPAARARCMHWRRRCACAL
jgi:transposase